MVGMIIMMMMMMVVVVMMMMIIMMIVIILLIKKIILTFRIELSFCRRRLTRMPWMEMLMMMQMTIGWQMEDREDRVKAPGDRDVI